MAGLRRTAVSVERDWQRGTDLISWPLASLYGRETAMRLLFVLPLIAALSVTACNKGGTSSDTAAGNGGSIPERAAAALSSVHLQPGLYQAKIDIKALDMPGMPEAVAAGVKGSMANKPMTYCLSAEDAAKGAEAMKEHMAKGKCQFNRFDVAGGTIDTAMSCQMGNGTLTATGHGTYTDTGTVVASTSDMTMAGGRKMHIEEVVTTTRVGDCTR